MAINVSAKRFGGIAAVLSALFCCAAVAATTPAMAAPQAAQEAAEAAQAAPHDEQQTALMGIILPQQRLAHAHGRRAFGVRLEKAANMRTSER